MIALFHQLRRNEYATGRHGGGELFLRSNEAVD